MYHQQKKGWKIFIPYLTAHFPIHTDLESFPIPYNLAPVLWMFREELLDRPPFHSVDATFVLMAHFLSQTKIHYMLIRQSIRNLPVTIIQPQVKMYKRVSVFVGLKYLLAEFL